MHERRHAGFAHRRLAIIDLETGAQPMTDERGNWITYNGEVYNYIELRDELGLGDFRTTSDVEVVLRAYGRWGAKSLDRLRGMFAFALWDESEQRLFCARDRFGVKPLYYAVVDGTFICASEAKALLPFLPDIETDLDGLRDYLAFQFCLAGKTMFKGVHELPPGHLLTVQNGVVRVERYWEVEYEPDFDHTEHYFVDRLREIVDDSVTMHLRADVPVGAYLSGGLDSSIVASLAAREVGSELQGVQRQVRGGPRLRRERVRARARRLARLRAARGRDRRPGLRRLDPRHRVPHGLPRRRPGRVPAVHRVAPRARAHEGRARRPGRRRDVRRLRALPARVLRAVHQGRDRRDDAQRQLHRHVRVDHPEPRDAARVQAADAAVLARGPLRRPRPALLPPHRPRTRPGRGHRLVDPRRLLAVRDVQVDLPRRQRAEGVVLRPDDALRLQDAPARPPARRGPREHGARARVACAVCRPRGRGVRRHASGRRQVPERRAEARAQADRDRAPAAAHPRAQGQEGLPRAARRLDARRAARLPARSPDDGHGARSVRTSTRCSTSSS